MATPALAERPPNLFQEFRAFLDRYGVIGLSIAFVIGVALTQLVQAVVKDVLMPTIAPILSALGDDWRSIEAYAGPFGPYLIGDLLFNLINFFVIAIFVFFVGRYLLREKTPAKK